MLQRDAERKLSDGSKFDAARCKSMTISLIPFYIVSPLFLKIVAMQRAILKI
jgi:hypothetical protein